MASNLSAQRASPTVPISASAHIQHPTELWPDERTLISQGYGLSNSRAAQPGGVILSSSLSARVKCCSDLLISALAKSTLSFVWLLLSLFCTPGNHLCCSSPAPGPLLSRNALFQPRVLVSTNTLSLLFAPCVAASAWPRIQFFKSHGHRDWDIRFNLQSVSGHSS